MDPQLLYLMVNSGIFAGQGSKDLALAASLDRFSQQLVFCAQTLPQVQWIDASKKSPSNPTGLQRLVLMDEAAKLAQQAINIRQRAAGG